MKQQAFFESIEEENPGVTPAANRPCIHAHLQDTFAAFGKLWRARNHEHITLLEIEAYVRLFSVPNKESFAEFMLASDDAVWSVVQDIATKKARLKKKLQGKRRR